MYSLLNKVKEFRSIFVKRKHVKSRVRKSETGLSFLQQDNSRTMHDKRVITQYPPTKR